jgi:hypothetical protein
MRNSILLFTLTITIFCTAGSVTAIAQPVALSANSGSTSALGDRWQRPAPDARAWTDPALSHNALLRERLGEGSYTLIGTFKVKGTPFLFGQRHNADLFSSTENASNIDISYNTYTQEVEFYSTANPTSPLVKEPGQLDSFTIKANIESNITTDLKFVYGSVLGSKDKAYFQVVEAGSNYTLYKSYRSELGLDESNYSQPELRQFDLNYEYYYYNHSTKTLKKLKKNPNAIQKEFKSVKDLTTVLTPEEFTINHEVALKKAFIQLNSAPRAF